MRREGQRGFTIIETMLFLAVTGLLLTGVLVGSASAIGRQRYRDSANDLHSFFQEQYSSVLNTSNQNLSVACSGGIANTNPDPASASSRGQTDCVLLGKMIFTSSPSSTKITVQDLYGYITDPEKASESNEVKVFQNSDSGYGIKVLNGSQKDYQVNWGVKVSTGDPASAFTLVIVRSPNSGNIQTFFKRGVSADPQDLLDNSHLNGGTVCLSPEGLFPDSNKLAIKIDAKASSGGAVNLGDGGISCP